MTHGQQACQSPPPPFLPGYKVSTHSRLEPVDKLDDMRVLQSLQHGKLVIDHLLVAFDILLQDNLDSNLASRAVRLTNDTIGTSTEGASEPILRSILRVRIVNAEFNVGSL